MKRSKYETEVFLDSCVRIITSTAVSEGAKKVLHSLVPQAAPPGGTRGGQRDRGRGIWSDDVANWLTGH